MISRDVGGELSELFFVEFFVEANDQLLPHPQRRRPQITGWAEQVFGQRVVVGWVLLHIKMDDLLPLRHVDVRSGGGQFQRGVPAEFLFGGVDFLFGRRVGFRKEPLRFLARGSARAVIRPIDLFGH